MNESLSILDLVINASAVVQAVMAILVLASLVSWIMIFQRWFTLAGISRNAIQFENDFRSGEKDLRQLYFELADHAHSSVGIESIFSSGFNEFTRS